LYFYYADEGLIGEFDATGASVRQYGYVPDSTWTTAPLYLKTSQGYSYYQNDHLGTPQQLIQKNGAKVWEGEFRAFGELTAETGSWENRLRFPGQYFDEETNNYYNYFRDYDPNTGRYLQSDPIGLAGGINTYAYVSGNPLRYSDPHGLCPAGGLICVGVPVAVGALVRGALYYGSAALAGWWGANTWNDGDYIPDGRYGGYDPTDEKLAVDLANGLTGQESCEEIAEAINVLNNRIRGRQENIDDDFCGDGDDGHKERIEILEDARDRLEEALRGGRCT
jgi:RHS repeat-associated protein